MNKNIIRNTVIFGLLVIFSTALITISLPRASQEKINYEVGQPWRYTLLTAPFDIPVFHDSITENRLSDSIRNNMPPYVDISSATVEEVIGAFDPSLSLDPAMRLLKQHIREIYAKGIVDETVSLRLDKQGAQRIVNVVTSSNTATRKDATGMLTPVEAMDSIVNRNQLYGGIFSHVPANAWDVLKENLVPNVTLNDSIDQRQLNNALAVVRSAQGTIRQGQRIVDRGEVVTPQIYRNLQEYEHMLSRQNGTDNNDWGFIIGQASYIAIIFIIFLIYLAFNCKEVYSSMRTMLFIITTLLIISLLSILLSETFNLGIYITPFAALPVVIMLFVDKKTAVITLIATIMIGALVAIYQFRFIFLELVAGLVAIFSLNQLSRRSQLLRVSVMTFLAYCICYVVMTLVLEGTLSELSSRLFIYFGVSSILLSLTYVFVFVIERLFGFTSTVTLVELSDINNPLLRRLSEEAPGTFQHSMQVSTLAANAASAIGADVQLARTGALYHDIGKLSSPIFFTENQHGVNPHNGLDPETSARKIISHVTEGAAIAGKAKLPAVIKDFILQHHGKGVTRYFYNTVVNANPDKEIDPTPFTYPGPNPRTKETAILMMADAVEAASRSLKEYTSENISNLVDKIIDTQVAEGMFRQAPISFADIDIIKDVFKRRLGTIYHSRVAYPERRQSSASTEEKK